MLERLGRGKKQDALAAIRDGLFPQQREFVDDPSRYKSALCPRRSGKSYAVVSHALLIALANQNAVVIYATLTRIQARNNVWSLFKQLNQRLQLGMEFHETNLEAKFPNGSTLRLTGCDSRAETERLRGGAYDLVIIDECKSFPADVLDELIAEVLAPALNDRLGQLCVIGTPGNFLAGPFYEATTHGSPYVRPWAQRAEWKQPFRWSFHQWTVADNTAVPHLWETAIADKSVNRWGDDDPRWRREYLGEWVASSDLKVYAFSERRDIWLPDPKTRHGLPDGHEWSFLLGVDFGFEDDFAAIVVAYSEMHPVLHEVWDLKAPHMSISDMARAIKKAQGIFGDFNAMVCDAGGFGKAMLATLNREYGFYFKPAEKKEKYDFIELLNCDLISEKLKIRSGSALVAEMAQLQWMNEFKRDVIRGSDDHACDALLYVWRYAYHHYSQPRTLSPEKGSEEYWQGWEEQQVEKAVAERDLEQDARDRFNVDYL